MKKLLLMFCLILLASCGKEYVHTTSEVEVEVEKEVFIAQDFEGFYTCDNYSQVELIVDYQDRVTFETSGQSLNSINPKNGSLGTHPTVSERDLVVNDNSLVINPRNYNYSSSSHDIEEDLSGSNITGNKRTDISVTKVDDTTIKIKFVIFDGAVNSNINDVIAERELNCTL